MTTRWDWRRQSLPERLPPGDGERWRGMQERRSELCMSAVCTPMRPPLISHVRWTDQGHATFVCGHASNAVTHMDRRLRIDKAAFAPT